MHLTTTDSLLDHSTVEENGRKGLDLEEFSKQNKTKKNHGGTSLGEKKKKLKVPCFEAGHVKKQNGDIESGGYKLYSKQRAASVPCEFSCACELFKT